MELSGWDVAAVAIKAVVYIGTLSAAGGIYFLVYAGCLISYDQRREVRRWLVLYTAVALLASVARIAIIAGSMGDDVASVFDGAMVRMVLQAGEGRATGIRIVGLLLAVPMLLTNRRRSIFALFAATVAATSFAWTGHAWAANKAGLSLVLLSFHLVGVAFWIGALVPLRLIARGEDLARTARTAARFGHFAVIVVLALIAAGASLLSILLTTWSDLWTTNYGRAVGIKAGAVALLLGVAALNKLQLTPRLLGNDFSAARCLRRSIGLEMLLAGFILTVTAIFTTLMGPPSLG